jgi:hypothetical protein
MGSRIEDSFYAPHELATEVQGFLGDNDELFSRRTWNEVAVVYSVESNRARVSLADSSDNVHNLRDASVVVPYRVATDALARAGVPFDVLLFTDGVVAEDRVDADALAGYHTVLLPDCTFLTLKQATSVLAHLDGGGRALVVGELGLDLPAEVRERLLGHPGTSVATLADVTDSLPGGRQVQVDGDVAVNIQRLADGGAAVHLLNYTYDAELDRTEALKDVELSVRLPLAEPAGTLVAPGAEPATLPVTSDDGVHRVRLDRLGVYAVLVLRATEPEPR